MFLYKYLKYGQQMSLSFVYVNYKRCTSFEKKKKKAQK